MMQFNEEKREMSVDEMIAAGLPWKQISERITQLQKEQKEKEKQRKDAAARMQADKVQKLENEIADKLYQWLTEKGYFQNIPTEMQTAAFKKDVQEFLKEIALKDFLDQLNFVFSTANRLFN